MSVRPDYDYFAFDLEVHTANVKARAMGGAAALANAERQKMAANTAAIADQT